MLREISWVFEEYVAVHYAKNIDTGRPLLEILLLRRKLWKFSFYFWKLGPLPRLFSFLELVLFGWNKFKVETRKSYWPVRDPTSYTFMYYLTDLTEMVLL